MKEINLRITLDEANLILEALGNLPFIKVYTLIAKVQEQAGQQLSADGRSDEASKTDYPAPTVKK
jgi:hypothetical protein